MTTTYFSKPLSTNFIHVLEDTKFQPLCGPFRQFEKSLKLLPYKTKSEVEKSCMTFNELYNRCHELLECPPQSEHLLVTTTY